MALPNHSLKLWVLTLFAHGYCSIKCNVCFTSISLWHIHLSMVSAQNNARIEELLQEDQNVKRRRERSQKQSSLLSKLTRQLSIHDNRAAAASWSNGGGGSGKFLSEVWSTGFHNTLVKTDSKPIWHWIMCNCCKPVMSLKFNWILLGAFWSCKGSRECWLVMHHHDPHL